MAKKFELTRPIDDYYVSNSAAVFSKAEALGEYRRLRSVALKRQARLERSEFASSAFVRQHMDGFPVLSISDSALNIRKALYDVAKFIQAKGSTVRGRRDTIKKFVRTMRERGYDFVTEQNAEAFGEFMDSAKRHYGSKKYYDSEEVVELYEEVVEREADPALVAGAFDYYLEDKDRIPDIKEARRSEAQAERASRARNRRLKERAERYRRARSRRERAKNRRGRGRR